MVRSRVEARSATSATPFVAGWREGRLARKTCAGCLAALLFLGVELLAANALCPVTGREADPSVQLFHEGNFVVVHPHETLRLVRGYVQLLGKFGLAHSVHNA